MGINKWFSSNSIVCLIFLCAFSNAQQITNIRVIQDLDNVVITYDITSAKPGLKYDLNVSVSTDKGRTFSITPSNMYGDLKGVVSGNNKKITWNVLNERSELSGDDFVFKLVATDINPEGIFSVNSGSFTDERDGEVYKWVRIGTQVWMAENLKATKYRDGTSIPNEKDSLTWRNLNSGAYCWYNNDVGYKAIYGALYNWFAANTGILCPKGWHVPTDAEWTTLSTFLGGESEAGGKMKTTTGWNILQTGATNSSGFSALPGGYHSGNGAFSGIGNSGIWWSSSGYAATDGWHRRLLYNYVDVGRNYFGKSSGFSVRCVRDF